MEKKDEIIKLFYEEHLKPTEIAKKFNVCNSYITKIIQKDERYGIEKENRRMESKERHKESKRNYINNVRQAQRVEYQAMLNQIDNDNKYLSTRSETSDLKYVEWNRSAFEYDNNSSDLVLKKGLNAGFAVCKRISNIIDPSFIKVRV